MKMSIDQAIRKARSLSPQEAETLYTEILARFPSNKRIQAELEALTRPVIVSPPSHELDAIVALYGQGRLAQARDRAVDLLTRFANSEILHNIAGAIHAALGRFEEALGHYDHALVLAPDYFEAWNNRGNMLDTLLRGEEAVASFDCAIRLHPDYVEAHINRGIALYGLKRLEEALASYDRAMRIDASRAEGWNNRGNVLTALNRRAEALADYDRAIALNGHYADAFVNRGNILKALRQRGEALASFDHAIALAPGHAIAHLDRGRLLVDMHRLDEALVSHEQAVAFAPGSALASAELANVRAHMCLWDDAGTTSLANDGAPVPPFYMLSAADDPACQLHNARAWTAKEYGAGRGADFRPRAAQDRIRIGYFSADFHNHATMYLMARMLELHDRARFEIHAFSYGPDAQDDMRQRLLDSVDHFHAVGHLGDAQAAALARGVALDIAVDLKGHTAGTRTGIFAHRAAPVQVGYLGYPGTTGADFIDYIIADPVTAPLSHQPFYTEKLVHLPHCYQVNDDRRVISDRMFSRAELSLPESGFVFCCFNNDYKITRAEFDIWMRLLTKVDGSVLWLLQDNQWAGDNLRREAQARGVSPDRLIFADRMPLADHLARQRHADLFLDTFNVNAHTTASDALWAGLPLITKLGESFVARVAGSLLHALDMPDLVTDTADAYEALALDLATNPDRLAEVKARLADNRGTAPLFDTVRFVRDIEAAYESLLR